jgi:WD40 repeat protein
MTSPATRFRYKAFISYSHAADGKLAPALQSGLERFAKPWYRRRAFRVFRDKTGLAVTPELWGSIQRALETSEYFVLLASPAAAQSEWVKREVEFWLSRRPADKLLIVLTDGSLAWDAHANDFDWSRTDALPRVLEQRFREEPNYLDLRWARADTDLSVRRPRFLDAIAGLAATLRQVPLDDLIGEDVAHYQTTRRLLRAGVLLLLLFSGAAFYAAYQANQARSAVDGLEADRARQRALEQQAAEARAREAEAARQRDLRQARAAATSRELASTAAGVLKRDRELATLLAIEAAQISTTPEADDALRRALMRRAPRIVLRGPNDQAVRGLEFSSDGRRVLGIQADASVWTWTLASPGPPIVIPRSSIIYPRADGASAVFSPDSRFILTAPFLSGGSFQESEGDNPAARMWDAATGRQHLELKHRYVQHAAYSPDGKRVVTVGIDSPTVVVWDAETGARLLELVDHESEVVSVDFTRDGKLFVTAAKDDTVRIRTIESGQPIAELQVPGKSYMTAALISPDGRRILTLSSDDPARLWDWQGSPGSPLFELTGHTGNVGFAIFSPDSTRLVTLAEDHTARVWDVMTGRNVQGLAHDEYIGGAAFSADSRWIATVSADGFAALWDAASGRRVMDFGQYERPRSSVAFSPDGTRVATGTPWGEVLVETCEICGSTSDLVARARARVSRTLTPDERKRYLPPETR